MAYTLLSHTGDVLGTNGGATSAIDTSGATLLVMGVAWYAGITADGTMSDSKSNTWTPLTKQTVNVHSVQLFYSVPTSVGSGHTFTYAATGIYATAGVTAWSGAAASPFDLQTGATGTSVTTLQTGSLTPSADNSLLVSALQVEGFTGTYAINSSFTISDQDPDNSGVSVGCANAYLVQTTAGAVNPTWDVTNASNVCAVIASFAPAAGGGGPAWRRWNGVPFVGHG